MWALHSALYSRVPEFMRHSDHHLELLWFEDVNISALQDINTQGNSSVFEYCLQIWICRMFSKIASKFKMPESHSSQHEYNRFSFVVTNICFNPTFSLSFYFNRIKKCPNNQVFGFRKGMEFLLISPVFAHLSFDSMIFCD